jgi:hypothetical protein
MSIATRQGHERRLGHANTQITMDLYMHVPAEMDQAAGDSIAAIIDG